MEMDSYTAKTKTVLEWIDGNGDLDPAMGTVLTTCINVPCESDNERKKQWAGIRTLLAMIPGAPISQRGSNCPVRAYVESRSGIINDANAVVFEAYGDLLFKHGKAGGGNFENAEEYLEYCLNTLIARLRKKHSAEEWSIPTES
mgnify:CR=1 FL=1